MVLDAPGGAERGARGRLRVTPLVNLDPPAGPRLGHLVGSIPAQDAEQAMALAGEHLGDALHWVPDGETGERFHWVVHIIEGLRDHPDLEVVRDGDWSSYDETLTYKVRKGHTLRAESLDFGHVAAFEESYPVFKAFRGDGRMRFQVGIPGDFDMGGFVLGPAGALRHRGAFRDATLDEIRRIHGIGGDDVVFQVEVPLELVSVARAPGPARGAAARLLGGNVAGLAAGSPEGARFGVHLCLGDMNHEALATMADMSPVVALANAIAAAWPAGRKLEFMHAPFAGASQPPPTDPAYYAPLARLRLPGGTRFAAGFAHEHQDLEVQRRLLHTIESAYGGRVDVSAACGLGRRTPDEAVASMRRVADLVAC